MKIGVSAEIG